MGQNSAIEWTGDTWNVVTGCTKVSPACANCYIERTPPFRITGRTFVKGHIPLQFHEDRLTIPLRKRKPTTFFVNSLSDLFHEDVPDALIAEVFGVMAVAGASEPDGHGRFGAKWDRDKGCWYDWKGPHAFQVLTKRPQRMQRLLTSGKFRQDIAAAAYRWAIDRRDAGYLLHQIGAREEYGRCYEPGRMWPLSNVWLGVSVENQHFADERIPLLLQTPAAIRFLSCEPLLGPINLRPWFFSLEHVKQPGACRRCGRGHGFTRCPNYGGVSPTDSRHPACDRFERRGGESIDWCITGGESGAKVRPTNIEWLRSVRDQCLAAGVPYFHKQNGGRTSKSGGRLLDGREWSQMPEARP